MRLTLPKLFDDPTVVCAGNDAKNWGTCRGDSGKHNIYLKVKFVEGIVNIKVFLRVS